MQPSKTLLPQSEEQGPLEASKVSSGYVDQLEQ